MKKGLKNMIKTLESLGVSYQTAGDPLRITVSFKTTTDQECEVSNGDYGNSWKGFVCQGKTSKEICKAIENLFKEEKK